MPLALATVGKATKRAECTPSKEESYSVEVSGDMLCRCYLGWGVRISYEYVYNTIAIDIRHSSFVMPPSTCGPLFANSSSSRPFIFGF